MNKTAQIFIERLKKDKRLLLIMISGFLGMLLLLISSFSTDAENEKEISSYDISSVEARTEEKLTALIRSVEGAGRVKVMVTVDSLEERTLAENYETESGENYQHKSEYVLIEQSGDSDGLTLKITAPVIRGVGITCEGAASSAVRQEIIRLVSAALGISVNRIWVTTMKE